VSGRRISFFAARTHHGHTTLPTCRGQNQSQHLAKQTAGPAAVELTRTSAFEPDRRRTKTRIILVQQRSKDALPSAYRHLQLPTSVCTSNSSQIICTTESNRRHHSESSSCKRAIPIAQSLGPATTKLQGEHRASHAAPPAALPIGFILSHRFIRGCAVLLISRVHEVPLLARIDSTDRSANKTLLSKNPSPSEAKFMC